MSDEDKKEFPFSLYDFFVREKDLFIIFGVFGALSLYFTNFLNDDNKIEYSFKFSNFEIHFLNLAISASLLLFIILSSIIVMRAFNVKGYKGFVISYIIKKGSIQRLFFIIPFIILIFGVFMYVYNQYLNEINQIGVIFGFFFGLFFVLIIAKEIVIKIGIKWLILSLIFFGFWVITAMVNYYFIPFIPSEGFLVNAFFTFNLIFGNGSSFFCIIFLIIGIAVKIKPKIIYVYTKLKFFIRMKINNI